MITVLLFIGIIVLFLIDIIVFFLIDIIVFFIFDESKISSKNNKLKYNFVVIVDASQ